MFDIQIEKVFDTKLTNSGSFLQTPFWCNFKEAHGWHYNRFKLTIKIPPLKYDKDELEGENHCHNNSIQKKSPETKIFELSVLNRDFAKGFFSIAYIPLGINLPYKCTDEKLIDDAFFSPEQSSVIQEEIITPEIQLIEFAHYLTEIAAALKPHLAKNTIAIRFDPDVTFFDIDARDMFNFGMKCVIKDDKLNLKKNRVDIQPPDSSIIDLTLSEDELLQKMHSKWRYNIRLSEKKGVQIKKYFGAEPDSKIEDKIETFYALTKETNARDGNSSHAKSYYLDLIKRSAKLNFSSNDSNCKNNDLTFSKENPLVTLYIAEHEGEQIASIMTLFSGDEAIYLYGASSNKKRNLMPNHLLQWTAIKDAKSYGSKIYDFYGMSPEGKNENHPMHGLYMFKSNFGGQEIHRLGSYDFPAKKIYFLYSALEKLRAFWYKKIIKKLKGR